MKCEIGTSINAIIQDIILYSMAPRALTDLESAGRVVREHSLQNGEMACDGNDLIH
ncbi:MAG: hypothetical protein HFG20_09765 [Anaerotruncus sp.]|nr:hypothetical protein [Anaerotruncus sp.]